MLTPFSPILPRSDRVTYEDLERAAKDMRSDPGGYRGQVEYERGPEAVWRWEIGGANPVVGLLGLYPLTALVPHEATTAAALTRPRHAIQIRPVMALVDESLPEVAAIGSTRTMPGNPRHSVTPVEPPAFPRGSAVIADGHHRTAAALRVGGDPYIMTLVVSTLESSLTAGAFHRAFAHPVPIPPRVGECLIRPATPEAALSAGDIALVSAERSVAISPVGPMADRYRGIPAGWVHEELLPALGLVEEDAVYLDGADAAIAAAHYGTAILLPGSDVGAVVSAARSGLPLPPKATRFRPKPLRGFAMRAL